MIGVVNFFPPVWDEYEAKEMGWGNDDYDNGKGRSGGRQRLTKMIVVMGESEFSAFGRFLERADGKYRDASV